jgi:selenocysteine-specific elongation factor
MIAIAAGIGGEAPGGNFTAAQFRDRLDNGRRLAILILEFFDRLGITIRRGDLRRVVPAKLLQFGPVNPPATAH